MTADARGGDAQAAGPRVAVFGGSFDPPHVGHALTVAYVLSTAPIDRVVVVPVYRHPFAKELTSYEHRLEMCRLAFEWLPNVLVSTVERDLGGESLTLRTLERLAAEQPSWQMRLVIGSDVLPDVDKWHRFDLIQKLAPPLVVRRAGVGGGRILPDTSSTQARELLARGAHGELAEILPARVLAYAEQHGLYQGRRG